MTFGRAVVPMEKISSHVAKLTFFSYVKPSLKSQKTTI